MSGTRGNEPVLRAFVMLLLVALIPALLSVWLHPRAPKWERANEVAMATVVRWPNVLWVDARASADFNRAHIPESVNLAPEAWESGIEPLLAAWSPEKRIVVYCDGHGCQASHEVAKRLRAELSLENVFVLSGGWDAWLSRKNVEEAQR